MSNSFIFELLADGTIQFVDPAVTELTGYAPAELIGQDWFLALFPHEPPDRLEAWRSKILAEDTSQLARSMRSKAGTIREFEVTTAVQRDQQGAVDRITGFAIKRNSPQPAQEVEHAAEIDYRALFENSLNTILLANDEAEYIDANSAACDLLGYSREELLAKRVSDLFVEMQRDQFASLWQAFIEEGEQKGELRLLRKDGSPVEVAYFARANVLPGVHLSIMHDISEQMRAGQELAESELRYRTLFETMAQGVAHVNRDGIIIAANPAASRIFGLPEHALIGRSAWDSGWKAIRQDGAEFPPEEFPSLVAMQTGEEVKDVVMGVFNPEDEAYRWIKIHAVPQFQFAGEKPSQVYLTFEDVSARVRVEQALRESEERYRLLVELSPDAIGVQSRGEILFVNEAGARILGAKSPEELIGRRYEDFLHPGDLPPIVDRQRALDQSQALQPSEVKVTRLDGQVITIESTAMPFTYEGEPAVLFISRDVTARKRIERSEREQRALAEGLRDISSALSSTLDYEEVLDRILENIARVAAFDTADILLVENGAARIVRWRGYDQIATGPVDVRPLSFKISEVPNFRQMAESGLPLVIPDTREFSGWVDIPELRFIRSFAGAPIRARGRVMGFLTVTSQMPGFYGSTYAPRMQALADQAAIALENSRLYEQVIAGRERMRLLTQQVVSAQEEERHRLSRELHDEAGQSLTALQIGLQLAHDEISPDQASVRRQLKGSIALAEATMDRMRFLAQNLRPPALDAIGLVPTLKDLCDEFALRSGLSVKFTSDPVPDLSEEVNVSLYRLLQEAFTNIIKHARAKQVLVAIHADGREVSLSICDDGKGFDSEKTTISTNKSGGIGLLGMQERLELIGGTLDLQTAPGSGTTLISRVPHDADHLERRQSHDTRRHRR